MRTSLLCMLALVACQRGSSGSTSVPTDGAAAATDAAPVGPWSVAEFPEPDAWTRAGAGVSAGTLGEEDLLTPSGYALGGPGDAEHLNLSVVHDGWWVHPWAPERGGGGISFFDASDPCSPVLVGQTWADKMWETHALAFGEGPDGRRYLAFDMHESHAVGGIGFFDVTDPTDPQWVCELATPGCYHPDAYLRVTFASFWQGDMLYVAAPSWGCTSST